MISHFPRLAVDQPAHYRILVQGWISERWADWFEGMTIAHPPEEPYPGSPEGPDTTCLIGTVQDQAALMGLLQRIYSLGFPLLHVECLITDIHPHPSQLTRDIVNNH